MKALSIKQPWASLIAHGIKDIENRTWKTNFRGRIYIHASAIRVKSDVLDDYISTEMFIDMQKQLRSKGIEERIADYLSKQPISAIIGEVEIIDCVINHPSIWAEKSNVEPCEEDFTWHIEGTSGKSFDGDSYDIAMKKFKESKPIYNWVLSNPVLYEKPILNVKGKLSFWEWHGCEQTCESCEKYFDIDNMQRDGADNYFCKQCADELFPIMQKEYEEMVANGEIEPEDN